MTSVSQDAVYIIDGETTLAAGINPLIYQEVVEMGIKDTILDVGVIDHNRVTMRTLGPQFSFNTQAHQVKDTSGHLNDPARARSRAAYTDQVDLAINDRIISKASQAELLSPTTIWTYSHAGQMTPMLKRLEDRRNRLDEVMLGYTIFPGEPYLQKSLLTTWTLPIDLKAKGWLETTLITSNISPIILRYTRKYQDQLVAKLLASVLASIWHFSNMKGAADVFHALGNESPLVGCSFGLRHLVVSKEVGWYKPIRAAFGLAAKGQIDLEHTVIQVIACVEDAFNDPAWRTIEDAPDRSSQCFIAIDVPLPFGHSLWEPLVANVERHLLNHHPNCTALWVSAKGMSRQEHRALSAYWAMAGLLYPLPIPPRPIEDLLARADPICPDKNGQGHQAAVPQTSLTSS